jgi:tetratricopeptide (TPR) repeat protein
MTAGRQGSLGLTLFISLAYGFASFVLIVNHSSLDRLYENDFLSYWLLAPGGAFCGFIGATWVHELGHFFAARTFGADVYKIQIGSGKLLGTFLLMGTPCAVHESLRSGMVLYGYSSAKNARKKMAVITAAAPLASIILAGASVSLLMLIWPLVESPFSIWHYPFAFLVGWTSPCLLFLPGVLLPYQYRYAGRKMKTDAMVLLQLPWMTDAEIEKIVSHARQLKAMVDDYDFITTSLDEALRAVEITPKNPVALHTAIHLLREAHDPRARDYFEKLLGLPLPTATRMRFIDRHLTYCLETNTISFRSDEMEKLSQELMETNPGNISVMGTRGSVLIDLGRVEEGSAMLKEVLEKTDSSIDKSYGNIFLALAEKQRGNLPLAREYAQKAVKVDPDCPALKRVTDLLA